MTWPRRLPNEHSKLQNSKLKTEADLDRRWRPTNFLNLITLTRNSDEAAAKELVEQLYPAVIRIVRNHLPRRESEEDLSQEIFLKIFAKLHQYRADMPFEHWVSRISVNTCIDHLRKQHNRPEYRWSDFSEEQQAILDNLKDNASRARPAISGRKPGTVGQAASEFEAGRASSRPVALSGGKIGCGNL